MSERWVNAVVEGVLPLDVSVDATKAEKLDAVEEALEALTEGCNLDWVFVASWRDEEE